MIRFAAALCLLLSPVAVQAQGVDSGQTFGNWTVSCEALGVNRTACVLEQTLTRDADGAFVAQVLAFWNADGSERFLAMRVPLGVYLASGIELRAEDEDAVFPLIWQTCTPRFCEALRVLPEERLQAFADGEAQVLAGYRPGPLAEPLVFSVSMSGVMQGLEALRPAP
ncbi:invasion associated locus B family protein [Thetidibacter halocola]|uniref:Invasion associated locus B family protein n=1 Tax=Thetidibacter halocola TaxID=2827239 RepID=A0A8J7WDU9_9RHOB|nr:invasion associated locus B family protein [Thetidibacter halocola]MBS0123536.1 invasion associated locus B family protein [Thetidibacter halocola]